MPAKGQTSWTDFQNQYLIDNYGKLTLNEIAAVIGKNYDAVDARRRRLGLQAIGLSERMKRLAREGKHPMQRPDVVARFFGDNNPSSRHDVREKISKIRKKEYATGTNRCRWKGPQKEPTEAEEWSVLRFTNEEVLSNYSIVINNILNVVKGGDPD